MFLIRLKARLSWRLGVIELKRSTVGVTEGIRQNLLNQEKPT